MLNLPPFDNLVLVVAMSIFFSHIIIRFTYRLHFEFFYYESWEVIIFWIFFSKASNWRFFVNFFAKKPWAFLKPAGSLIRQKVSNNWEPEVTVRIEKLHNTGFFWLFFTFQLLQGG
jgi:hypothetical protein